MIFCSRLKLVEVAHAAVCCRFKDLWYPAFFLLFVIVSNACHVHL